MLTAEDLTSFTRLGIPPDLLMRAHVARVSDAEARDLLQVNHHGRLDGIAFPRLDPDSGRPVGYRIRRDHPELEGGRPRHKYLSSIDRAHLYFPPDVGAWLTDVDIPCVIVEAEKSVLAIHAAGHRAGRPVLAIGTGGCWGWRGRIGKTVAASGARVDETGPLPDWDRITWAARPTTILFDSNAAGNASVETARRQLQLFLAGRGAAARISDLPTDAGVNGPDDLIAIAGDAAFWAVLEAPAADFVVNRKQRIVADSLTNIRLALAKLGVTLGYDAFARTVLVNGAAPDDITVDRLWVAIDDTFHFRPSKGTLRSVILVDAHTAASHPVREYLAALQWDGMSRLDGWLSMYGGATSSAYVDAVGALVLIAAVRRVCRPGAKFDELLVLESPQGTGKSSALRVLCPLEEWFSDDLPLGVESKQVIERTAGKWILEASEMYGHRGREAEQLKAFLSRQEDGPVRLAYDRLSTTVPRQFVIVGTTNMHAYLKDHTGSRRFWPVRVGRFDVAALARDRDQLWAEAAARDAAGASIRLDPDLWSAAGAEQEQRRTPDPWEATLEPLFAGDGIVAAEAVPVSAVWEALKLEASHRDNRHADRVAAIAQRFGFTAKEKRRTGGVRETYWIRTADASFDE